MIGESDGSFWKDHAMLRVNLTGARVGMTLAMPVFHPTLAGHTLLRPGFVLDELTISRLTELHVGAIWIRYPALASVMKYISPAITMEHAAVTHLLGRLLDSARLGNGAGTAEMDFVNYAGAVRSLVGKLVAEPDAAILIGDLLCATSPLAMHSGNVCFLSLLMGLKLEAYLIEERRRVSSRAARAVESLGLGALLHDVGVERLSPETRRKWLEGMSEDEPSWREHARLGYDLVRGKVEPSAAVGGGDLMCEHGREDGRAGAHEGSGEIAADGVGNGDCELGLGADVGCEAAVASDDGGGLRGAEVLTAS